MFSFTNLFYGLIAVALGTIGLKFNFKLVDLTGPQDWIERYMGSGSTYTAYKLFSILLVLGGLLWASGYGPILLEKALRPLADFFPH